MSPPGFEPTDIRDMPSDTKILHLRDGSPSPLGHGAHIYEASYIYRLNIHSIFEANFEVKFEGQIGQNQDFSLARINLLLNIHQ